MEEDKIGRAGLMSKLSVTCSSCNETSSLPTSTNATVQGKSYDINRRAVYHSIETGGGYEGLASFCRIMNMPCMTKNAYLQQLENIMGVLEEETRNKMKRAGQRLRQNISGENQEVLMTYWMLLLVLMVRGQNEVLLL